MQPTLLPYSEEEIEATLNRFATIGAGMHWAAHHDGKFAAESLSFSLSTLMMHLGIPRRTGTERLVKLAIREGMSVYYFSNGSSRDVPTSYEVFKFQQH